MNILGSIFGLTSGIGSLVDSLFGIGSQENKSLQDDSQAFQRSSADRQMDFQREERHQSQQYQEESWRSHFDAENEEYWRRLEDERAYNSPQQQVARAAAAGLNPLVASGGVASDSSFAPPSVTAGGSSSAGNGASASGVTPPYVSRSAPNIAEGIAAVSQFISAISKARKDNADAGVTEASHDSLVKTAEYQATALQLANAMKQLEYTVLQNPKYGALAEQTWKVRNQMAENYLLGEQAHNQTSQSLEADESRLLKMAQRDLTSQEYFTFLEKWSETKLLMRSMSHYYTSSAWKNSEEAKTIHESRDSIVQNLAHQVIGTKQQNLFQGIKNAEELLQAFDKAVGLDGGLVSNFKNLYYSMNQKERREFLNQLESSIASSVGQSSSDRW